MSKKDNLDKIGTVILNFFESKRIKTSLDSIYELGITGWEKWWQTEFALYLANNENIAEWDMEHPFDTDRRTNLSQEYMALDIGFRMKNHSKNEWYFVELKQDDDYKPCIDRMCKDGIKVFSARKKSFDGLGIKYIACAGVFKTGNESGILEYAENKIEQILVPRGIDNEGFFLEKIGKRYSVLIF